MTPNDLYYGEDFEINWHHFSSVQIHFAVTNIRKPKFMLFNPNYPANHLTTMQTIHKVIKFTCCKKHEIKPAFSAPWTTCKLQFPIFTSLLSSGSS